MAQRFNADDSDHSGSTRACACGRTVRYAGRRLKTFITLLGPLTLERAYYHCDACRSGMCPRDQTLGIVIESKRRSNRAKDRESLPRLEDFARYLKREQPPEIESWPSRHRGSFGLR